MSSPVLFCTVGGSARPIVSAIRDVRPGYVVFLVTEDTPNAEGVVQPGSRRQLEGPEGIPACAELAEGMYEGVRVAADDPDGASATIGAALRRIRARFADAPIIADYTGGTKSMSSALLAATLNVPGVRLQVMAGLRRDLVRVTDGTERAFPIVPDLLLAERQISLLSAAWGTFGYADAEAGFLALGKSLERVPSTLGALGQRVRDLATLSGAFAAWDRFDHKGAFTALEGLPGTYKGALRPWRTALEALLDPKIGQAVRLLDLWRNAERRATRGQYDDAVARCYRLIEATAQYLLNEHCRIDTGRVVLASMTDEERRRAHLEGNGDGFAQANLSQAWTLVGLRLHDRPAAKFMRRREPDTSHNHREARVRLLKIRNYSILAHGWEPIGAEGWRAFERWMRRYFIPEALLPEIAGLIPGGDLPQLPKETLAA